MKRRVRLKRTRVQLGDVYMPKSKLDILCRETARECKAFFADPENMRRFEEWKAQRDADLTERDLMQKEALDEAANSSEPLALVYEDSRRKDVLQGLSKYRR